MPEAMLRSWSTVPADYTWTEWERDCKRALNPANWAQEACFKLHPETNQSLIETMMKTPAYDHALLQAARTQPDVWNAEQRVRLYRYAWRHGRLDSFVHSAPLDHSDELFRVLRVAGVSRPEDILHILRLYKGVQCSTRTSSAWNGSADVWALIRIGLILLNLSEDEKVSDIKTIPASMIPTLLSYHSLASDAQLIQWADQLLLTTRMNCFACCV